MSASGGDEPATHPVRHLAFAQRLLGLTSIASFTFSFRSESCQQRRPAVQETRTVRQLQRSRLEGQRAFQVACVRLVALDSSEQQRFAADRRTLEFEILVEQFHFRELMPLLSAIAGLGSGSDWIFSVLLRRRVLLSSGLLHECHQPCPHPASGQFRRNTPHFFQHSQC